MHRSRVKKAAKFAAWAMALAAIAIAASAIAVYWVSSGRVFDKASINNVPQCRAAIVLGCRKILAGGQSNMFFTRRIAAAAELYKAHKVDCLIVSGDNHIKEYDEASDMKDSLVEAGVPADRIVCDYAGFRTLDSVVRAKKVFGLNSFIVVSQGDHVRRAVFTARGFGCDAYGYAAQDVRMRHSIKTPIREQFAKVAAVLDVILRRGPKFLGPRELLPDKTRIVPSIDGSKLPIRDFKLDELRLGDVAGMEALYSTRVGKIMSPSGEVTSRFDVAKLMRELRLPTVAFKPPTTLADALLHIQSASAPPDGSGRVVLFALMPRKNGEVYPSVPEISAEDISLSDILWLVCKMTDVSYGIRDDGVIVVKPKDLTCDDGCKPGETWLLQKGVWPQKEE